MLATVGSAVFAIAFALMPRLSLMTQRRTWLYAVALAPLLLPVPYAAFLWEPLFAQIDIVYQPRLALFAIALVQVWRLWPLCILATPLMVRAGRRRVAAAAALITSWLALTDTGTPLLSTGGQPFNETHVWASWSFQTLWVSRLWAYGAVMALGLAAASAVIGILIWRIMAVHNDSAQTLAAQREAGAGILAASAGVALFPLLLALPSIFEPDVIELLAGLARLGYWRWAANTLAVVMLTAAAAALVVLPARAAGAGRRPNLLATSFIVGLAIAPVQFWLAVRWLATANTGQGLFFGALAAGLSAGLIALWPTCAGLGDPCQRAHTNAKATVVFTAAVIVLNQFALGLVLANSRAASTLGTGAAVRLAGTSSLNSLLEMASLLTFALASASAYALLRWLRRQGHA